MDFITTIAGVTYTYSVKSQTFVITGTDSVVTLGVVSGTGVTPTEVDVKESDGSEETFVPEAPVVPGAE